MDSLVRISDSIRQKGLRRSLQSVMSVIEDFFYDLKYHAETSQIIEVEDLDIGDHNKKSSCRYQPTRRRHFKSLMKELAFPEESVFVDMGSGKGRVLMMASQHGFKRVKGIEISKDLCEIARANLLNFQKKVKSSVHVEVIQSNVLRYRFDDKDNVFYVANPFDSTVMQKVMENLRTSLKRNPRKVWLIFNNFHYDELFPAEKMFKRRLEHKYGGTEFVVFEN